MCCDFGGWVGDGEGCTKTSIPLTLICKSENSIPFTLLTGEGDGGGIWFLSGVIIWTELACLEITLEMMIRVDDS